jgi:hypothetical protein
MRHHKTFALADCYSGVFQYALVPSLISVLTLSHTVVLYGFTLGMKTIRFFPHGGM